MRLVLTAWAGAAKTAAAASAETLLPAVQASGLLLVVSMWRLAVNVRLSSLALILYHAFWAPLK